jgi:hypothetical protein
MAKVCWATGADPADRYRLLAEFCSENGLAREARFYERSLACLRAGGSTHRRAALEAED